MNNPPPVSTTISNGLATTRWLAQHLRAPWLRVVDVQRGVVGPRLFIEGAVPLDVARVVDADGAAVSGAELAMAMSEIGVGDEHTIVLVDEGNTRSADAVARVLRRYGHEATMVLSGGIARWRLEKLPLATAPARYPFASFTARMDAPITTRRGSQRRAV